MANVVVIGAGPAGSSAAYHLAQGRHQVTLVDKQSFPRDKTCGDGIGVRAIQAMGMMGLYTQDIHECAAEYMPINGLLLAATSKNYTMYEGTLLGYCIPRMVLDNLLYDRAINAGAVPLKQRVMQNDGTLQQVFSDFDYIIDARGVYAGEANVIASRNYWTVRDTDFPEPYRSKIHIYFDTALGAGYGWVFPVAMHDGKIKLNLGVGMWKDDYRKQPLNIMQLFEQFVQQNEQVAALSRKVIERDKPVGCYLATAKESNRVGQGRVLKIGDAANLTDPLTGEGIANAILSGFYAAQAIHMSSRACSAAENWQRLYRAYFEEEFRSGLRFRPLRKSRFVNNLLVHAMRRIPRLSEHVSLAIGGLIRYNEIVPSLLHR